MNINIILDPEYICKELSEETSALRVCNLFMMLKHKSNIIIIQDKDKKITTNILHQLAYNFENMENQDFIDAQIFITELAKGTNQYDFITDEPHQEDMKKFIQNLKNKNYPLKFVISDKDLDQDIKSYSIDKNFGEIVKLLEKHSKKHIVTDNKELINEKKTNVVNFDEYKEILFHTFWCSDEITIVAKEFYDGFFNKENFFRASNRRRYEEGFKFLFECFKEIEKLTKKKLLIKIISGLKPKYIREVFKFEGKKNVDELFDFINQINKNFSFELKLIRWDVGDEIEIGEGHGRRIYSDYGGFDTGYMPFEIHGESPKKGGIFTKDTNFAWIDEGGILDWTKIGDIISSRPS